MNPDIITEWASIQHVVVNKTFDEFVSTCAEINGIFDYKRLHQIPLTTTCIDIYYCMLRSTTSGIIYVLFPSGIVLTPADLSAIDTTQLVQSLNVIIEREPDTTIVLAGYSMGCVLALYVGHRMQCDHLYIIGAAGGGPEIRFREKTTLFVSGELRHNHHRSLMLLDRFSIESKGDAIVLYYDTKDRQPHCMSYDDIPCTISYPDMASTQCEKLHAWSYYHGLIIHYAEHISHISSS